MHALRGTTWGPLPLPEFLIVQLGERGLAADDAPRCAAQLSDTSDPAAAMALFVDLGACKLLEGDVDGAVATWRHALSGSHDESACRASLNLGLLYEQLHLHANAVSLFSTISERNVAPYVAPAVMAAARCHRSVGNIDAAMEIMARLAQWTMAHGSDTEQLAEVLYGLGDIAAEAGRADRAERAWRVASAGPTSVPQQAAVERLLALLAELGRHEELFDLLDRLDSDADLTNATAAIDRACTLHQLGRTDEAAAMLAALVHGDLSALDRFKLAAARCQLGLVNEGIDQLEILLNDSSPPVSLRAGFVLGELYREHSMFDAALSMYERVLAAEDSFWSPKAALALGDLFLENGDSRKATEQWRAAASSPVTILNQGATERLERAAVTGTATPSDVELGSLDELGDVSFEVVAATIKADSVGEISPEPQVVLLDNPVDADDPVIPGTVPQPRDPAVHDSGEPYEAPAPTSDDNPIDPANAAAEAEPQVVVLAELEPSPQRAAASVDSVPTAGSLATAKPAASVFRTLSDPNPYAALAPEGFDTDPDVDRPNPYAELAPNYDDDEPLPSDIRPGDWESMLDDWPRAEPDPPTTKKPAKKRSSAFSRYT